MTGNTVLRNARRAPIAAGVAISLLLHLLLLAVSARGGDEGRAPQDRVGLQGALQARLLDRDHAAMPLTEMPPDGVRVAGRATQTPAATGVAAEGPPDSRPGSGLGLAAAVHYIPARELDVRPQIRSAVEPEYPRSAFEQGRSAAVRLRVLIDARGRVDAVSTPGHDEHDAFAAAARAAFAEARYTPGLRAGVPVPSELQIEVRFDSFSSAEGFRSGRY
jgi:TonB family protein